MASYPDWLPPPDSRTGRRAQDDQVLTGSVESSGTMPRYPSGQYPTAQYLTAEYPASRNSAAEGLTAEYAAAGPAAASVTGEYRRIAQYPVAEEAGGSWTAEQPAVTGTYPAQGYPEPRADPPARPAGGGAMARAREVGGRHRVLQHRDVSGGWLRPAVFGAMDGLVTNASLIAGVGGGGAANQTILLTGLAGLIAGAFSMATGEYVSVRSQNELTEAEVVVEQLQHDRNPQGEQRELAEVFVKRGVEPRLAEQVARQISADPEQALTMHVREELGIDPDDLPSPWTAAGASFVSFTAGALIPLVPYLIGFPAFVLALTLAGVAAFVGGAAVARLTGRPALVGGMRQFVLGALATGMTFYIGHLVGTQL